ncbi:MAG: hypothetical protein KDD44_04640, partial [Bdellovibrionales bacterium]|nr:hypothetical protein [Bdellovibrionales bacterium]
MKSSTKPAPASTTLASLAHEVMLSIAGSRAGRATTVLIIFAYFILFCRPQHNLRVLGTVEFPLLISLLLFFTWVPRIREMPWTIHVRLMVAMLLFGALWVPFARNNFWAFHTFRDLATQYLGFVFPLVFFAS